jgi:Mrp family chromosome partitioning ATPase
MHKIQPNNNTEEKVYTFPARPINPLASLAKHYKLAMLLALIVLLVGLPISWIKGEPKYYTEASIYVSPRFMKNLQDDNELDFQSNSQYREYVQQQVRTVNRYDIVADALESLGERKSLWVKEKRPLRRSIEFLQRELKVQAVPDTYQITVGLENDAPEGIDELVNAVVESYLKKIKQESFYDKDKRLTNLKVERDNLYSQLNGKLQNRTAIAKELGVTTFSETLLNPYDQLLVNGKQALAQAQIEKIEKDAKLQSFQGSDGESALEAVAEEIVAKDPGINSLKANLNLRRSELLSKISGLGEKHPVRKMAERELSEIEMELTKANEKLIGQTSENLVAQRKKDFFEAQKIEQQINKQVNEHVAKANWFTENYQKAIQLGTEIEQLRSRVSLVDERINFLSLESDAPGMTRFFSRALPADQPVKGGRKKIFLIFFAFATFIGLSLPLAIDFIDPRILYAGDLERVLGFAPIGVIAEKSDKQSYHQANDQLIRIAGSILRDFHSQKSRVISLTSTRHQTGTTSLSLDLSQVLNELGIPTLTIEANNLSPDNRYMLAELSIAGKDSLLPDRITLAKNSCPKISMLRELTYMLKDYLQDYQIVIIDCPPLLTSADTEIIIGMSDITLLAVQAIEVDKSEVRQAASLLEKLSPNAIGVILNRVPNNNSQTKWIKTLLSPWLW